MKKVLEKIEFLIHLCEQMYELLKAAPETLKSLAAPEIEFLSLQQVADKCFVKPRQVGRWITDNKIEASVYLGAAPYFANDYIEEVINSGRLRRRKL